MVVGSLSARPQFERRGGRPCLDLANTVSRRSTARPEDRLRSFEDLLSWGREAGALTAAEAAALRRRAAGKPKTAAAALRRMTRFREAFYRAMAAVTDRRPPRRADLEETNRAITEALGRGRVVVRDGGLAWEWAVDRDGLGRVLWSVARSAAEVLTSNDLFLVRRCAASDCGALFVDTTRNRNRRWCEMRTCGNRAKVRRYYERRRSPDPSRWRRSISDRSAGGNS